jgi:hypothetical protein
MTNKQEAFVKYYTGTRDAKAAVRHAGYSRNRRAGNIVREVLNNPKVKAAILKRAAEGAASPTPVVMDEKLIWAELEYLINANLDRRPQIALTLWSGIRVQRQGFDPAREEGRHETARSFLARSRRLFGDDPCRPGSGTYFPGSNSNVWMGN